MATTYYEFNNMKIITADLREMYDKHHIGSNESRIKKNGASVIIHHNAPVWSNGVDKTPLRYALKTLREAEALSDWQDTALEGVRVRTPIITRLDMWSLAHLETQGETDFVFRSHLEDITLELAGKLKRLGYKVRVLVYEDSVEELLVMH